MLTGVLGATNSGLRSDSRPPRSPVWPSPSLRAAGSAGGLTYGASTTTWQIRDSAYRALFAYEAGLLFTEDDFLWYRVRPTPSSPLLFRRPDQIVSFAERLRIPVLGAHLVWDQGFGRGWTHAELWGMSRSRAERVLFGTVRALVERYAGRVRYWSVVNEAVADGEGSDHGLRRDVPWYQTIGAGYVAQSFRTAHTADPAARLILNDFGFETASPKGEDPVRKQAAALRVVDALLAQNVPVHAFGLQAHLVADDFADRFDRRQYTRFLAELADRGLEVLITELDVLDTGLPAAPARPRPGCRGRVPPLPRRRPRPTLRDDLPHVRTQ